MARLIAINVVPRCCGRLRARRSGTRGAGCLRAYHPYFEDGSAQERSVVPTLISYRRPTYTPTSAPQRRPRLRIKAGTLVIESPR